MATTVSNSTDIVFLKQKNTNTTTVICKLRYEFAAASVYATEARNGTPVPGVNIGYPGTHRCVPPTNFSLSS
eukprot:102636-Rhodomonas_salina.1